MDLIKDLYGNGKLYRLSMDPSGIDISGENQILRINSDEINGDLNISGDISINGDFDISGDISINGDFDICGNMKFDDIHVHETWFGPDLRGGQDISGGGWVMMKNQPPGHLAFDEYTSNSNSINFTKDSGIEGFSQHFSRPTNDINFTPDEILITSIASDGQRVWWILDYTIASNVSSSSSDWSTGTSTNTLKSSSIIKASSVNVSHITHVYSWNDVENIFNRTLFINNGTINPSPWKSYSHPQINNSSASQFPVYRANTYLDSTDYNNSFMYHQGVSIFFRDSNNIQANPKSYPTMIKKETDHLHITAPLNIYSEGDYELDKLGFDGNIDLQYDNYIGSSNYGTTIDNNGGWYIVRQSYNPTHEHYHDNFNFGINHGTLDINNLNAGDFYSRNVSNYDYDEVLFWGEGDRWLIFDRTALESFKTTLNNDDNQQVSVKKSSVSSTQHLIYSNPRVDGYRPHIFYSNTDGTLDNNNRLDWTEYDALGLNNNWAYNAGERKYYVRRSDGQPVRLKNKVKVDVDGNLDVDGAINGIITTANGNVVLDQEGYVSLSIKNSLGYATTVGYELGCIQFEGDTDHKYSYNSIGLASKISCVADAKTYSSDASRYSLAFHTRRPDTARTNNNDITESMRISSSGFLGIGTTNPSYPLEIYTSSTGQLAAQVYYFDTGGVSEGQRLGIHTTYNDKPVSAKFWEGIWIAGDGSIRHKNGVIYSSDERIKTNISLIDDDLALKKVNALESKQYNYKGLFQNESNKTIGFIAQDVLKVIPEAVSFQTSVVPDEFRLITEPEWDNNKLTVPDLDMSANNFTGKCKFYVSNDLSGNDEKCVEIECETDLSGNKTNQFSFEQQYNNVFFYGKEVNDFHTIDKNQIFALHHSAIQELDRKHTREVTEKNNEITELKSQLASLTSRMESLEASVLALQNN